MTDFIRIGSNPVPEGGEITAIETADGARLRAAYFPAERARGAVILMAGRCEFIEKYFEVIETLRARGLSVATMDWRGQGLSARLLQQSQKGHIDDYATYVADLKFFAETHVKERFSGPYILMTHSMGGLPALMWLAEGAKFFARAVLCAPMTKFQMPKTKALFARASSNVFSTLGAAGAAVAGVREYSLKFEGNRLTSNRRRHDLFRKLQEAAPEACVLSPTYGWLHQSFKAIDSIHRPGALSGIKTPTLIVSAEYDDLVSTEDHRALAAAYPRIDQVTVKGALHEILMERWEFAECYWKAFDAFVGPILESQTKSC